MLLRESYALEREARWIEDALYDVWARGVRTADVAVPGAAIVGTREMGHRLCDAVRAAAREPLPESA